MNESLQGWRLALALLVPAVIIGAAGYIAYGALTDDDQNIASGNDQVVATSTPIVQTQPVDPTAVAAPTAVPAPTALAVPTAVPAPDPTAAPEPAATVAPTPAPTAAPAPAATATPSGPAPTATPDPSVLTLACAGDIPATTEEGVQFGPLSPVTNPPELVDTYTFLWDFGNGSIVTNSTSGLISYSEPGSYTVTVRGTGPDGTVLNATCGTVTIDEVVAPFRVVCSVSLTFDDKPLLDARASDTMTVTVTWTPNDKPLNLQYEFDIEDDLIIAANATSGNQQTNAFNDDSGSFSVFWRDPATGETGLLGCPAYPGTVTGAPTPTAVSGADGDSDNVEDLFDNCPSVANTDQINTDGDAQGDACDDDDDNDNRLDIIDNCPLAVNFDQIDSDGDGEGDACEVAPTPTATPTV